MATLRTPKNTLAKRGRKPLKPLHIVSYERGSITDDERQRITGEFAASGCNLVWVPYTQGSRPPEFHKVPR